MFNNNQQPMFNMNYNPNSYDSEILKCVMEGMGEASSDNAKDNLEFIMNYVKFEEGPIYINGCKGDIWTISFDKSNGTQKVLKVPCDAKLKDVLRKYVEKCEARYDDVRGKIQFLANGKKLDSNNVESLKDNQLQNNCKIVVLDMENVLQN